jgi:hypothetical protein
MGISTHREYYEMTHKVLGKNTQKRGRDIHTHGREKILSAREGETERELSGSRRKDKGPW